MKFSIKLEKVKEIKVFRVYLNIAEVLANVGGILKVLMIGFMVSAMFISKQMYNLNLVNDIFIFEENTSTNNNNKLHVR